ncbi:MAG TPA: hypothetical protein VJC39_01185 [Candidatus Nanoarchaeia archaeon]|nr:hypothetical protein [Candidatus Nanoarchaeia archaeon]
MPERTLIIDHLKFSYEGIFNPGELYNLIAGWFYDKGWDWYEKINQEEVTPQGRQITLILEPWKSSSDYYKLTVRIKMIMSDLKEVDVEHSGKNLRLSQGTVRLYIDGYIVSDRNGKWTKSPFYWFISYLIERVFNKSHFARMEDWIRSDVSDLYDKIKSYLNAFNYSYKNE